MVAMGLGAYLTALLFEWGSRLIEEEGGAWNSAGFSLPAHKHLLFGGLAFGAVFMVTDPVTSPVLKGAKWVYGFLCGFLTILIRVVNPAYAEGVMFAILIGNVFAPMIDNIALERVIKKRRARVAVRAA
jgi:Na+-transporting NADH:ubiquinone oxidoreductase subunit B